MPRKSQKTLRDELQARGASEATIQMVEKAVEKAPLRDDWHCDECGAELRVGASPWCRDKHALPHSYKPFEAFETEIEGLGKVKIDSMKRLREVEAETMRRWKAGERVAPTVFRQYSQDASNRDKNTFGRGPAPEAEAAATAQSLQTLRELRQHIAQIRRR